MWKRERERERTHLILSISSEDVKFSFMSSTSKLTSLSKFSLSYRKTFAIFLFIPLLFFLAGKDNFGSKRITSEQFLEKKFHFSLKMCLNIISFSRFSGKSTVFSSGRPCQRLKKLFLFSSKGGRNYQDPFFQKSFSYSLVLCLVVFFFFFFSYFVSK